MNELKTILEIVITIIGVLLSILGLVNLIRSEKTKKDYRIWGTCSYIGLALTVFGLIITFDILKYFNLVLVILVVMIVFSILRKILLPSRHKEN